MWHNDLSSERQTRDFVRATYAAFLLGLGLTVATGFLSYYLLPRSSLYLLAGVDSIVWIACGWLGWRQPIKITFGLFVVVTGLLLGQVAHFQTRLLAISSLLSLLTFGGLSAYVYLTEQTFSFLRGLLWISFYALIGTCLLLPFAWRNTVDLFLSAAGTFLFGCWILYDTGQILGRRNEELTPATAAFELILDLIGLRSWLDGILGERD